MERSSNRFADADSVKKERLSGSWCDPQTVHPPAPALSCPDTIPKGFVRVSAKAPWSARLSSSLLDAA